MVKIILFVILLFMLAMVDPPLASFIAVGLMPAFTSMMIDTRPEKSTGRTVLFFSFAGVAKFMVPMLSHVGRNNFSDALNIFHLFVVYAFAAMGYFVAWMVPRLFVIYADYKNQERARTISEKMTKLLEEWGTDIRG